MPGLRDVQIDARTALFAVAASMLAAVLAGAIPAVSVMRTRLAGWLADRSGGPAFGALRAQQTLAVVQIGLAVALLVTAALLVESFRRLRAVDVGFEPARVTTAKVSIPASRYPDAAARVRFADALLAGVSRLPGVDAAALIDAVPMADNRQGTSFERLDAPASDATASPTVNIAYVTEGYFDALGIPLLAGRSIDNRDAADTQPVVVINRRLARQVFGDEDPIGRLARIGVSAQRQFQVIGVVGDERHFGVETEATPSFFVAYRQAPNVRDLGIIIRSAGAAPPLREVMRGIDPDVAVFRMQTMAQVVDQAVATPRSMAWLLSVFALSALMLAAIGVFGVMSHAVGQRTREIGVRMAIGASPAQMLRAVLSEGMLQVAGGVALGGVLTLLTARLLSGLLFGVAALSVAPYLVVTALLGAVSVIACLVPARRAMRIDPAMALRAD
jgi:putative ABC transport system permease protein